MLPELQRLVDRIIVECEDYDALDARDMAYLEQIKTVADLGNFTDSGDGGALQLACDAAKALGQSSEWVDQKDAEWYEREDKRRHAETRAAMNRRSESPRDFSHSGLGISGLATYDEPPTIPSVRTIERMEQIESEMQSCRCCGASDLLDGAMFTTDPASGLCDDCC